MAKEAHEYVGRGGLKLKHALREFGLDVTGLVCADFGCNVGGFTDCLLRHGAARVYAIDTGYGALDYRLRTNSRVVAMERTNALHADPPAEGAVDLVVADMGWTPQRLIVPAARRWLGGRSQGRIITLIKPHYEASASAAPQQTETGTPDPRRGRGQRAARDTSNVLDEAQAAAIHERVLAAMPALGVRVLAATRSPIRGGASKGRIGNVEYLALLAKAD